MTREDDPKPDASEPDATDNDDAAMTALLKRSLDAKAADAPPRELLRGVQKRIRTRSRGKFYADGWSTSSTRVSYMMVAIVMLVILGVAYFALGPTGISAH